VRVRVGIGRRFELDGQAYYAGAELDVSEAVAVNLIRAGLVVALNGLPDALYAPQAPQAPPVPPRPVQAAPDPPAGDDAPPPCGECEPPTPKPGKALAVCSTSRCPCLVVSGRCPGCKRAARQKRGTAHQRGYDGQWERTRRAFLKEHPYCACPECLEIPEPLRPAAQVVDHIDGLGPLGPRGHDLTNLRAMTKQHHDQHTARTQPGGWNDREA
jgi:hypothetical protein